MLRFKAQFANVGIGYSATQFRIALATIQSLLHVAAKGWRVNIIKKI
ncbi:MAG: hypothetical protein ETSY1_09220 [Candidatus Entotheonella factor]|uniref:Uncharacterized protein n=1 Tax=Entotheonella factor TaxID=1429438 RepID=W4LSP1_ENTF1|nr:MAG: hypothetical protein ETSY1_09305 [Candidatus Entotheonella factor]ETX00988.1 MAG: hypothetical protein ETSY1_09220 [Candidatus Entotheonella factor]